MGQAFQPAINTVSLGQTLRTSSLHLHRTSRTAIPEIDQRIGKRWQAGKRAPRPYPQIWLIDLNGALDYKYGLVLGACVGQAFDIRCLPQPLISGSDSCDIFEWVSGFPRK